ncbi:MAG: hypothetical protein Kapaf2KO_02370 [Candidatus Kapaibacteriales bacterium]
MLIRINQDKEKEMEYLLSILLIILSALLILVVLIQPGKGEMLTGVGGISGQFNSVLGTKKATDLLKNITIYTAVAIGVLCLVYNIFLTSAPEAVGPARPSVLDNQTVQPAPATAPEIVPSEETAPEAAPSSEGQTPAETE